MRRPLIGALAAAAVVVAAVLVVEPQAPQQEPPVVVVEEASPALRLPQPPPTEHWLDEGAEKRNKQQRKAWIRGLHRTPPGVDYKAIELQNGLAQIAKRNALTGSSRNTSEPRWVERGSDNLAGRMHVALHSPDQQWLYAGSALGGIWKRDLEGGEWYPLGDNLYGGSHWLAVLPGEGAGRPEVVLAATDWGLVHRSDDGGLTWSVPQSVGSPWEVRRVLTTQDGSNTLFLITGTSGSYRLLRSVDSGQSFEEIRHLGSYAGDLWTPRTGEDHLYLIDDDEILTSRDLGDTWTVVGSTGAESGRGELVGSEAGAPRLWAILDAADLYRSDDAGGTWEHVTAVEDYWGSLAASVYDVDVFAWGGVEVYRTDDGENFQIVNGWGDYYGDPVNKLHADVPGIDVVLDAELNEIWYVSTDGGLYHSLDKLATVENLSLQGLRVSQYYSTLTSSAHPDHLSAGSQDQGYQWTTGADSPDGPFSLEQTISGDYAHLTSGDGTHDHVFSVYPGFILVQVGEEEPWWGWADFPAGEEYAWLPRVVADPQKPEDFFFCATHIYRYTFDGEAWTPEKWSDKDFGDSWYEWVSALAFSPIDPQRAWAATNYGRLFYSIDGARSWTPSEDMGPEAHYFNGNALLPSSSDVDTVWVGGSGYGGPAVYRSIDGGETFHEWGDGLPDTLVYCLGEAPDGSGTLVAGTETAAYRRDADADEWVDITGADAPVTIYWSVEALTAENTMRFGTYGRGIWDYQMDPDHTGCYPVQDYDNDGVDCDLDCDDHDPDIHPGAEDACDGMDVDCDENSPVEVDADADGYLACAECDDANASAYPGAEEVCDNGVDEDCDGEDLECGGCSCRVDGGGSLGAGALLLFLLAVIRAVER